MKSNPSEAHESVYSLWEEWASAHATSFFQTVEWARLLEKHFPQYTPAPVWSDSFFVPLMRHRRWGGITDSLYGMPMMTAGGIWTDGVPTKALWRDVCRRLAGLKVGTLAISFPPGVEPLENVGPFVRETTTTHVLQTEGDWDCTWRNFDKGCREAVRRARRLGVECKREETESAVTDHWEVVRSCFEKWKLDPQPTYEFVRDAARSPHGRLFQAVREGEVVVSLLAFLYREELFFWQGARAAGKCPPGANNLLYAEVIRTACERGCRTANFGGSLGVRGIEKFKEEFGARKVPFTILKRSHPAIRMVKATQRLQGGRP